MLLPHHNNFTSLKTYLLSLSGRGAWQGLETQDKMPLHVHLPQQYFKVFPLQLELESHAVTKMKLATCLQTHLCVKNWEAVLSQPSPTTWTLPTLAAKTDSLPLGCHLLLGCVLISNEYTGQPVLLAALVAGSSTSFYTHFLPAIQLWKVVSHLFPFPLLPWWLHTGSSSWQARSCAQSGHCASCAGLSASCDCQALFWNSR